MGLLPLQDCIRGFQSLLLALLMLCLSACMTTTLPKNPNQLCQVFHEHPAWYRAAKQTERRWQLPVAVQMAIVHQESKFNSHAQPARRKLFWLIPWRRPSTAYGYAQALGSTWDIYRHAPQGGGWWASRSNFKHAVDFIGWYSHQAYLRAAISKKDVYHLYLAYHEGITGFQRNSYLEKPWLMQVAQKVALRAQLFDDELGFCRLS